MPQQVPCGKSRTSQAKRRERDEDDIARRTQSHLRRQENGWAHEYGDTLHTPQTQQASQQQEEEAGRTQQTQHMTMGHARESRQGADSRVVRSVRKDGLTTHTGLEQATRDWSTKSSTDLQKTECSNGVSRNHEQTCSETGVLRQRHSRSAQRMKRARQHQTK